MTEFNAADYGIDWPTTPRGIVEEAVREFVGDGEGADAAVLSAFAEEVRAPLEAKRLQNYEQLCEALVKLDAAEDASRRMTRELTVLVERWEGLMASYDRPPTLHAQELRALVEKLKRSGG